MEKLRSSFRRFVPDRWRVGCVSRRIRDLFMKNSISFVLAVVSICCLLIVMISMLRLPDISLGEREGEGGLGTMKKDERLGKLGQMMIDMLPEDLAFTVFLPSEKAFKRDLSLSVNDTYATVSRILGFSTVPRILSSATLPLGKEMMYDSLSGFTLNIVKDYDGMLVVNGVRSERTDLKKGEIVVHIMDGVIMDAEFQQSVQPQD